MACASSYLGTIRRQRILLGKIGDAEEDSIGKIMQNVVPIGCEPRVVAQRLSGTRQFPCRLH